jgi:fatty acid/phospholipid biosynthesis enzyme
LFKGVVTSSCATAVGNIVLKFTEGLAEGLSNDPQLAQEFAPDLLTTSPVMKIYPSTTGRSTAGPLLGVNGCASSSRPQRKPRVKNAIRVGKQLSRRARTQRS